MVANIRDRESRMKRALVLSHGGDRKQRERKQEEGD